LAVAQKATEKCGAFVSCIPVTHSIEKLSEHVSFGLHTFFVVLPVTAKKGIKQVFNADMLTALLVAIKTKTQENESLN